MTMNAKTKIFALCSSGQRSNAAIQRRSPLTPLHTYLNQEETSKPKRYDNPNQEAIILVKRLPSTICRLFTPMLQEINNRKNISNKKKIHPTALPKLITR